MTKEIYPELMKEIKHVFHFNSFLTQLRIVVLNEAQVTIGNIENHTKFTLRKTTEHNKRILKYH